MNILAVDSTSENLVLALMSNDKFFSYVSQEGSKKHNSIIMPAIDEMINLANITIKDIDYFACVVGPGSFTGIRIGVSTVKALALALNKKTVSITSFEELAFGESEKEFCAAIDCRHDNFYYAKFLGSYKNVAEVGEMNLSQLQNQSAKVIQKTSHSNPQTLIEITKEKIMENNFSELNPFYLKKSQAEREYELKNMDNIGK